MRSILFILALVVPFGAQSQVAPEWTLLPDSPFHGYRSEDVFFIDAEFGWAVNGDGEVHRTTDGGDTWTFMEGLPGYARATGFANRSTGWVGLLFTDDVLFETLDGGESFTNITSRIQASVPGGICGLWVVNDQVVYGVGQYSGPAYIIKTADGGQTWTYSSLSPELGLAVDVRFFDADHGFVVGGGGGLRIIETTDGGDTWTIRHTSSQPGIWGWKLSFPTPLVGYASAEGGSGTSLVAKTVDGGLTWTDLSIPNGGSLQGLGFLTPEIGWASGRGTTSVTTNGGQTWEQISLDGDINRFRFLGDSLGYAAGHQIYRLGPLPVSIAGSPDETALGIESIAPNPTSGPATITYRLNRAGDVRITIFDLLGRIVGELDQGTRSAGRQFAVWTPESRGRRLSAGTYLLRLQTDDGSWSRLVAVVDS